MKSRTACQRIAPLDRDVNRNSDLRLPFDKLRAMSNVEWLNSDYPSTSSGP